VCTGRTGHVELVQVVYLPERISIEELLKIFWQSHDPTQGNRQGNDHGTQYRSAVYWTEEHQRLAVEGSLQAYGEALGTAGLGPVTTETGPAGPFWFAEVEHQQYLAKNPGGYCGLAGTGVACSIVTPSITR
jgi:peptide-methionine (S)-S-oxide reductase